MSLLNVVLEDKAAFVAVDTEFRGVASGSFFHGDKMLILPSAGAVFASRGERTFLHWVFNWYLTALQTHDFDAIKGNLLQVARAQFAAYREQCKAHAVPADHFENIQLVVVGYSEQDEQFIGLNVTRRSGDPDFMLKRMETGIVSPEFKRDLTGLRVPDRHAWLLEVARAQVAEVKAEDPDSPIGGRLLVAHLSRREIIVRDEGRLPE